MWLNVSETQRLNLSTFSLAKRVGYPIPWVLDKELGFVTPVVSFLQEAHHSRVRVSTFHLKAERHTHSLWKKCGMNKGKAKNNPRYKSKLNLAKFTCLIRKCLTRDSDLMWSPYPSRRFRRRICLLFWFCRTVQQECTRTWVPRVHRVQWPPANLQQWIPHRLDDDTGRPVCVHSKNKTIQEPFDHLNHFRGMAVSGL